MTNPALEQTVEKILDKTQKEILSNTESALGDSLQTLNDAAPRLGQEYDKILADGRKEADKIEKQIIGSSDLQARNRQLMALEKAVDRVFAKALDQISNTSRSGSYAALIKSLLDESIKVLGTSKVVVFTSAKDKSVVQSALSSYKDSKLSSQTIECLGGVKVQSQDGTMTFDNTIDAKIQRLKPLIRKEIAAKFGASN